MKVTDEQLETAYYVFVTHKGVTKPSIRAAIESLPEPLPRLRPLSEMPAEVPEGAVRLTGYISHEGDWCIGNNPHEKDTHGLLVILPLPEPAKPDSLQDELVTALDVAMAYLPDVELEWAKKARALIAKAKGGQP